MSNSLKDELCLMPNSLRLVFSTAADSGRISNMLDPTVKGRFDPDNHVAKRLSASFNKAVAEGSAAMLLDENDNIRTLTMAYHAYVDENPLPGVQHDHTNFGSSLSLIPGYRSASLVIAALLLREWLLYPPVSTISAGIVPDNTPSIKTYEDLLGWEKVNDRMLLQSIMKATWRTLPDPSDPTGNTCLEVAPPDLENVGWYLCNSSTLSRQAQVVLDFIDSGRLISKCSTKHIDIDLQALEDAGLSRKCLEAIAGGVVSRPDIIRIGGLPLTQ